MNFFNRVRLSLAKAVSRTADLPLVPSWIRYGFLRISHQTLIWEGYKKNSVVFACMSALAFGFPEPPLCVYEETEDGEEVINNRHELRKLLRRPNASMSEAEFDQYCVVYAALGGNAYIWKKRNRAGEVIELWIFHDGHMKPIPSKTTARLVDYYELDVGGDEPIKIGHEDIIQWKWMPDPSQPWRGMGALEACFREAQADNEAVAYMHSLLKNNGIPPVIITLVEGDELTDDKATRLRKQWLQRYGGDQRGVPGFLEAGMKVEKLGMNLQELAFEALTSVPEARICAAFRVPPVIAGVSVGIKRSDYGDRAARRAFVEDTLASLWRQFAAELETGLEDEFEGNWRLGFDLSKVRALQEDEYKRWASVVRAWQSGMIMRSTGKRLLGLSVNSELDNVYFTDFYALQDPNARALDGSQADDSGDDSGKHYLTLPNRKKAKPKAWNSSRGRKTRHTKADIDRIMQSLREKREEMVSPMQADVDEFFKDLADLVVQRVYDLDKSAVKTSIDPEDILSEEDFKALMDVAERFALAIVAASWADWNLMLDADVAFDLGDPAVTQALADAGLLIRNIVQSTLDAVRETLQYGSDNGWGIDQIVRGDPEAGIRGLRDVVQETYKDRAVNIARTELGTAQNSASLERFDAAGLEYLKVLDNGFSNSNENCKWIDGQVRPLAWAKEDHPDEGPSGIKNPLQHPRCVRAFRPLFDFDEE